MVQGDRVLAYCGMTGWSDPTKATRWYVADSVTSFLVQHTVTVKSIANRTSSLTPRLRTRNRFVAPSADTLASVARQVAGGHSCKLNLRRSNSDELIAPRLTVQRRTRRLKSYPAGGVVKTKPTTRYKSFSSQKVIKTKTKPSPYVQALERMQLQKKRSAFLPSLAREKNTI